ncbi:hypothetical protein RO3G_01591 [Rhizopus delemar RA 99-880]|uniref:Uncharacterized protein n=1 Tax=Rhizopus delemar (strain RA 99-880 / ATCC MYA-4621 / FGSC 9543 / NRRL 43880) TaxID=246409 RepID=I1BL07_RHIO9|nr:hypothetical protein RO3G_01591 [Rhizopus delemar RA 99-880]|eukprot:EIE76887.1 hypothetical protein RO3G_01591 [Rhizopus delemar RA 99-880]
MNPTTNDTSAQGTGASPIRPSLPISHLPSVSGNTSFAGVGARNLDGGSGCCIMV